MDEPLWWEQYRLWQLARADEPSRDPMLARELQHRPQIGVLVDMRVCDGIESAIETTLMSLLAQSYEDWHAWLLWDDDVGDGDPVSERGVRDVRIQSLRIGSKG